MQLQAWYYQGRCQQWHGVETRHMASEYAELMAACRSEAAVEASVQRLKRGASQSHLSSAASILSKQQSVNCIVSLVNFERGRADKVDGMTLSLRPLKLGISPKYNR